MRSALRRRQTLLATAASPLLLAVVIAVAAVLALGRPQVDQVRDFLTSGRPDRAGAIATTELLVWLWVAGLGVLQLAETIRRAAPIATRAVKPRSRARVALLAGVLVFAGGAIHQQAVAGILCCGNAARAEQLTR